MSKHLPTQKTLAGMSDGNRSSTLWATPAMPAASWLASMPQRTDSATM